MPTIPDDYVKAIDPDGSIVIESVYTTSYEHTGSEEHSDYSIRYEPFIGASGQVGYRCTRYDGSVQFVYLNPSSDSDEPEPSPDVFLYKSAVFAPEYEGTITGDPASDMPQHFYNVFEAEDHHVSRATTATDDQGVIER